MLKFSESNYKVSLTWDSVPQPLHSRSNARPTELGSLAQQWSSTVDTHTRNETEANKLFAGC